MAQTQREGELKMQAAGGTSRHFHATGAAEQWQSDDFQESEQPFTSEDFKEALKKVSQREKRDQASS